MKIYTHEQYDDLLDRADQHLQRDRKFAVTFDNSIIYVGELEDAYDRFATRVRQSTRYKIIEL